MKDAKSQLFICHKNGKPCYDKKTATTVKNSRWKRDRVELRIYNCCYDHWHVTKQIEPFKVQKDNYDKNHKRKPKHKKRF